MTAEVLFLPILLPVIGGVVALFLTKRMGRLCGVFSFAITAVTLAVAIALFNRDLSYSTSWGGFGFEFALRNYQFSSFIVLAAAGFGFLISLYSVAFMRNKDAQNQFFSYFLITLGFTNGAVLANHLIVLLFFWEGLLLTLFAMIAIGHRGAYKTAVKAFVIAGVADLCLMLGVGLTAHLAGTMIISDIHLPVESLGSLAFVLLMIGAISKAGSMPFHSWIPDAAVDAPLPFMALVPASLEKLLGIYFLTRVSLNLFQFSPASWLSTLVMAVGACTILFAVLMALIQRDYKKLLSFHAISQVGYMVLGIGTAVPAGIVGGIFHMLNHALYKSCLFLTGGAVEKQAGTTDLSALGGLRSKMPLTFLGFFIAACSISGVPPFNGFFSKELVYDGALERGAIFYLAAVLGSFFTAASFLKLGHAAFLGKPKSNIDHVKEAPAAMLVPILTIAGICILFGLYNALPLNHLIQPVLGERLESHNFGGFHMNPLLVTLTIVALAAALLNHLWGAKKTGSGLTALDHIHHAPVAHSLYDQAERGRFDPYHIGMAAVRGFSKLMWVADRGIDYIYNTVVVEVVGVLTTGIRKVHTGSHAMYVAWALLGLLLLILYIVGGF